MTQRKPPTRIHWKRLEKLLKQDMVDSWGINLKEWKRTEMSWREPDPKWIKYTMNESEAAFTFERTDPETGEHTGSVEIVVDHTNPACDGYYADFRFF